MKALNKLALALLTGGLAMCGGIAVAGTATGNLSTTASITASCTVGNIGTLAFGSYDPITNSASAAQANFDVTCTSGTAVTVGLSAGSNPGTAGDTTTRELASGSNKLAYDLFSDSGHTTHWGNTVGTDTFSLGNGTGVAQTYTVYGLVAAGQNTVPTGSYTDTITITANF